MFLGAGTMFSGMVCVVGAVLTLVLADVQGDSLAGLFLPLLLLGASLFVFLIFGAVGVMALYQGRNEEVRLTADSFIHLKNRTQTALRLNEITSVRSVWHSSGRRGHWAVLIADGTGRTSRLTC